MIKLKLAAIVAHTQSGVEINPQIAAVLNAKGIPVKQAYHLSKIGAAMVSELRKYDEHRARLVREFGEEVVLQAPKMKDGKPELDAAGNQVMDAPKPTGRWAVKDEHMAAFTKAHGELLDAEFEIPLRPLTIDELGDNVANITPAALAACHGFIVDAAG